MSLTEYPDVVQGTDEWLELRRGVVTASLVGQLITQKSVKPAVNTATRALTALLVAERVTGWVDPTFLGPDMERGIMEEPVARAAYASHYAPVTETGFMIRDDWGYRIGYSPDGLVGSDGLIEIKCPRSKRHLMTVVTGEMPADYVPQVQCGLLVSGREWCDYVSFCSGMPLFTKRIYPDQQWFDAIITAVERFEDAARLMTEAYWVAAERLPKTERIDYGEII